MNREPRTRLPLAGLLIIFVAPLASLMIIVPSLFAGTVQKVQIAVPAIISHLPNPLPHDHGPRPHTPGLPPVAVAPRPPAVPFSEPAPVGVAPLPAVPGSNPATAPVVATNRPPVLTTTARSHPKHGRKRRHRPHQDAGD